MYRDMREDVQAPPAVFTAAGLRRGALGILAIVPAAVAFGLVYGVAAAEKGMTVLEVALSCMLIFAGPRSWWRWNCGASRCRSRRWRSRCW
jgi:hypothetical protein